MYCALRNSPPCSAPLCIWLCTVVAELALASSATARLGAAMGRVVGVTGSGDEDALVAAVKQARSSIPEGNNLTTAALFSAMQQMDPSFKAKGYTLAQVRKADKKLQSQDDNIADTHGDAQRRDGFDDVEKSSQLGDIVETCADFCNVHGDGLHEATVRQAAYFWVEAHDAQGNKRDVGGDTFFIAIRGPSQIRARITDNKDGTYLCVWKPNVSGVYSISISHFGIALPNTPFVCQAEATMPCPAKSIVRGEHLTSAVSRATHHFEVLFKDRLGQVAHAVDLDVYVEPLPPTSPRHRKPPKSETDAEVAEAELAPAVESVKKKKESQKEKDRKSNAKGPKAEESPSPSPLQTRPPPSPDGLYAMDLAKEGEGDGKGDVMTRYRMMRVKVGEKALIVRASFEKGSAQVGRLFPGQIVTIIEERVAEEGEVRACVSLDSVALSIDGTHPSKFKGGQRVEGLMGDDAAEQQAPAVAPSRADAAPINRGLTGWVTLVKAGRKLVTSRVKLGPGSRRQYLQQWARRKANDRAAAYKGGVPINELKADPMGIGFGFGGVEPGTLHARGQLHEVHKVSYSVGLAGQYLMHVRLRQQAVAMPGSPFKLVVRPGAASAKSTRCQPGPFRGTVGNGPDCGCQQELRTKDKMGNMCIEGGANIKLLTDLEGVDNEVVDHGDGSYQCVWKSKYSGHFKTRILIDGEDVIGSPLEFTLTSSNPELSKSEIYGDGLKTAMSGKAAYINIKFVDQFSNTAIPGPEFKFGMAINKEKDKVANAKAHDFEGAWEEGDTGVYEIQYTPTLAGVNELHVWCDPSSKGERIAFPGSPFHVHVAPGEASAVVSKVEGWSKQYKDEKNDKYGKSGSNDPNLLYASDTVSIRPQIFDEYSNPTVLPEGALRVFHHLPTGIVAELTYSTNARGGVTSYDIRHDASVAGAHSVHIVLNGEQIKGSPVAFSVLPDKPDPSFCKLRPPEGETLYAHTAYSCLLKTFDKFNNECKVGGLTVSARLQLIKQGVHDQTALVPSNHSLGTEDHGDGTYSINLTLSLGQPYFAVKLFVNMDKNLPGQGGELPSLHLQFHQGDTASATESKAVEITEASPAAAPSTNAKKGEKLRGAAAELMLGFGAAEERRDKDVAVAAAEAFAEGTNFVFDKDSKQPAKSSSSLKKALTSSRDGTITPNASLFDKDPECDTGTNRKRRPSLKP